MRIQFRSGLKSAVALAVLTIRNREDEAAREENHHDRHDHAGVAGTGAGAGAAVARIRADGALAPFDIRIKMDGRSDRPCQLCFAEASSAMDEPVPVLRGTA